MLLEVLVLMRRPVGTSKRALVERVKDTLYGVE